MSELTIHTGPQGDWNTINVDWFDANNIKQKDRIDLVVLERDKPRTLSIRVNGVEVAKIEAHVR